MSRHRFRGLLPFCLCRRAYRQKGRRVEIGSPSWFRTVAHHAAQPPRASRPPLCSLLSSPLNRRLTDISFYRDFSTSPDWGKHIPQGRRPKSPIGLPCGGLFSRRAQPHQASTVKEDNRGRSTGKLAVQPRASATSRRHGDQASGPDRLAGRMLRHIVATAAI